jgi:hypothetical protein
LNKGDHVGHKAIAWVFLEAVHDDDKELPVGGRAADVEWADR